MVRTPHVKQAARKHTVSKKACTTLPAGGPENFGTVKSKPSIKDEGEVVKKEEEEEEMEEAPANSECNIGRCSETASRCSDK